MRRAAGIFLWLYVFTIPWEHSTDIGTGIGSVSRVMGIVAMLAGLVAVAMRGSMRRMTLFHATVGAFYLLVLASYFWTVDADATAKAIRTFAQAMWVAWLIWEFAPDVIHRSQLMFAFVAGGYVTGLLTVLAYAGSTIVSRGDLRFSPDGWNPNQLGILMALGIPMAAMLVCRPQKLLVRAVALGYLLLAPLVVVLTASRDGFVAMAIAATSIPFLLGRRSLLRRLTAVLFLIAIATATVVFSPANSWKRLATVGSETVTGNLNDRLPIWRSGLRTFESNALHTTVGIGADGFLNGVGLAYVAHNTYLSILVNFGIVGFTVFLLLLLQALGAVLPANTLERLALIFCLVCWMVAVTAATWEQLRPTWFLFGLIAASGCTSHPAWMRSLPRRTQAFDGSNANAPAYAGQSLVHPPTQ